MACQELISDQGDVRFKALPAFPGAPMTGTVNRGENLKGSPYRVCAPIIAGDRSAGLPVVTCARGISYYHSELDPESGLFIDSQNVWTSVSTEG
jgi:hypothetical protein